MVNGEEQEKLQAQISELEIQDAEISGTIQTLTEEIQDHKLRGLGHHTKGFRQSLNVLGERQSKIRSRLQILRDSQSIAEAQQRTGRFEQQVRAEETRQAIQKGELRLQREAESKEKESKETITIKEAKELTGVSNIQFLSPQKQHELIERAVKERAVKGSVVAPTPSREVGWGMSVEREALEEHLQQNLPKDIIGGAIEFNIKDDFTFEDKPEFRREPVKLAEAFPSLAGTSVGQIDPVGTGFMAFASAPARLVGAIIPIISRIRAVGTIERTAEGTKIGIITRTSFTKGKDILTYQKNIAVTSGKRTGVIGEGTTFKIDKVFKLSSTRDTLIIKPTLELKDVEPFVSGAIAEKVGVSKIVREGMRLKVEAEAGESILVRSKILQTGQAERDLSLIEKDLSLVERDLSLVIFPKQTTPDVFRFISGEPKLRIKRRSGDLSLIVRQPKIRGTLFDITPEIDEGVKILSQAGVKKKTPLSLTFKEQEAISQIISTPKTAPSIPPTPKVTFVPKIEPEIKGGEQTISIQRGEIKSIQTTPKQRISDVLKISQQPAETFGTPQKLSSQLKTSPRETERLMSGQAIIQPSAQQERLIQGQLSEQGFRTSQKLRSVFKSGTPPPTTITPPPPPPLITPPPIIRFKQRQQPQIRTAGFGVQVRRGGKFRSIGSGLSLRQAFEIGTQRVRTTLGATFKITSPSGKGIKGIPTPKGFRKKKGGLFIEKKELRLSTTPEVKEIQTARLKI